MWRDVRAVIRREYLQRVLSRWFVVSTLALPLFMAAAFLLPVYFGNRGEERGRRIAIIDETGVLYERIAARLVESGWSVERGPAGASSEGALRIRVDEGELGAFLVLDAGTLATGGATLHARERPSGLDRLMLRTTVSRAALERGLEQAGVDTRAMLEGGDLRIELLSPSGVGVGEAGFAVPYVGAFFLYIGILMYAVAVMRATLEEKTSRIVEIIVSSMRPWHLMLGKILGVGAVGLTQMSIWLVSGALLGASGLPMLLAARPDAPGLAQVMEALPSAGVVVLFVAFFVMGFFMYSGLYACVGAMCNTDQEAQQAQAPLVVFIVAPILLVIPVMQNPTGALATSLSLFPLFTPILMWARVTSGGAPGWQVALSFALMAFAVLAIAWVAGRIYKVGILMMGKRPTLPELWRWVKEA
jgi:ABC-2 type transport system permease protein